MVIVHHCSKYYCKYYYIIFSKYYSKLLERFTKKALEKYLLYD